jgi:hypothetical protein
LGFESLSGSLKKLDFKNQNILTTLSVLIAVLLIWAAVLHVPVNLEQSKDIKKDLCGRFDFEHSGNYKNDVYGYSLDLSPEYCWFEHTPSKVYFSLNEEAQSAFTLQIFPFSLVDEDSYLRTSFGEELKTTNINVDGVQGLRLTGKNQEFILLPLERGTLRITIGSDYDLDRVLSKLRFDKKPVYSFEWKWATYRNDAYGFQFRYPTNPTVSTDILRRVYECKYPVKDALVCLNFGGGSGEDYFQVALVRRPETDSWYQEKIVAGEFAHKTIQGKDFIEMYVHNGYDGPGSRVVYIPNGDYWLRITTPDGELSEPETWRRITEKVLETIVFPPILSGV